MISFKIPVTWMTTEKLLWFLLKHSQMHSINLISKHTKNIEHLIFIYLYVIKMYVCMFLYNTIFIFLGRNKGRWTCQWNWCPDGCFYRQTCSSTWTPWNHHLDGYWSRWTYWGTWMMCFVCYGCLNRQTCCCTWTLLDFCLFAVDASTDGLVVGHGHLLLYIC